MIEKVNADLVTFWEENSQVTIATDCISVVKHHTVAVRVYGYRRVAGNNIQTIWR